MTFKVQDHYFKKAKKENYLARSIYKLEEIDVKYKILQAGNIVLDLGYYPGSWIQYTAAKIGEKGLVVGVDIQSVNEKLLVQKNVKLFKKDIFTINSTEELGVDRLFDTVISDMAPKTMGIKSVDQARSLNLVEDVFAKLPVFLKKGGNFVIKVFESHDAQLFLKSQKTIFDSFDYLKPKSTRSYSKEFFVIGKGFKA